MEEVIFVGIQASGKSTFYRWRHGSAMIDQPQAVRYHSPQRAQAPHV